MAKAKPQETPEETVEAAQEMSTPEAETAELIKPDSMPRALFEKIKAAHEEADALDRKALVELLDELTRREAHPAEAAFADLVGLDEAEKD